MRLIFLKRLRKVRDFSYEKIPEYVDEYDRLQRIYFEVEKVENEKELEHLKRLYEMVEVGKIPEKLPVQIPFSFASLIAQISRPENFLERSIELLRSTGHVKGDLSDEDKERIMKRIMRAGEWAKRYAPEQYRIKLNEKIPKTLKISDDERDALLRLKNELDKDWTAEDLQNRIYQIGKELDDVKRFFKILYTVLIGKKSGPRAGPFIMAIGKDRVKKILEQLE